MTNEMTLSPVFQLILVKTNFSLGGQKTWLVRSPRGLDSNTLQHNIKQHNCYLIRDTGIFRIKLYLLYYQIIILKGLGLEDMNCLS